MNLAKIALCASAIAYSAPAAAATLLVDTNGQLIGADDVIIGGKIYNVAFSSAPSNTCSDVFSGCDDSSVFTFNTVDDATDAAQALFDQVLVGGFDSDPSKSIGCEGFTFCVSRVPYFTDGVDVSYVGANNNSSEGFNNLNPTSVKVNEFGGPANWASFTYVTTAIPEPGTWAMMMLGLFGLGAAMRRTRVRQSVTVSYA